MYYFVAAAGGEGVRESRQTPQFNNPGISSTASSHHLCFSCHPFFLPSSVPIFLFHSGLPVFISFRLPFRSSCFIFVFLPFVLLFSCSFDCLSFPVATFFHFFYFFLPFCGFLSSFNFSLPVP